MITIVKRNGSTEPLSEEKYNRVVMWGVENIRNVSASAIAMGAAASIFDGMTTSQLHEVLVKSAADLISKETPNYSQVAARLSLFKIRKDAFGQYAYRACTMPFLPIRTNSKSCMHSTKQMRAFVRSRFRLWTCSLRCCRNVLLLAACISPTLTI